MLSPDLDDLYRRHAALIFRRCRAFLRDEQESLDAVQDVFVQLQRALPSFRGDADLTTWIYRITTNHCLNRLRSRARWRNVLATVESLSDTTLASRFADDLERRELLQMLLSQLSAREVQVLVHTYYDDMTQPEIATVLGVSERTIRSDLRRATAELRERYRSLAEGT